MDCASAEAVLLSDVFRHTKYDDVDSWADTGPLLLTGLVNTVCGSRDRWPHILVAADDKATQAE